MPNLSELPDDWRERAKLLREFSGEGPAVRAWECAAQELEQALRTFKEEAVSLADAAKLSGYTADHLGVLLRTGKLRNVGRKNAPAILRSDVPVKRTKRGRPRAVPNNNRKEEALRIVAKLS